MHRRRASVACAVLLGLRLAAALAVLLSLLPPNSTRPHPQPQLLAPEALADQQSSQPRIPVPQILVCGWCLSLLQARAVQVRTGPVMPEAVSVAPTQTKHAGVTSLRMSGEGQGQGQAVCSPTTTTTHTQTQHAHPSLPHAQLRLRHQLSVEGGDTLAVVWLRLLGGPLQGGLHIPLG